MLHIRKSLMMRETLTSDMDRPANRPIVRAVAMAVIRNQFAGRYVDGLTELFKAGRMRIRSGLAAVGRARFLRQGRDCRPQCRARAWRRLYSPMLGKPMRTAVGGGKAVIPSNVKVAACGASLDLPLSHKDESWSFDHFDTITVSIPDAPKPDEIVVVIAVADGGRLHPRCGSGPQ